jgi:RNA-directed DNA polymerase
MLSNLVMKPLDQIIHRLAKSRGFCYTRYADDLAFSTSDGHSREATFALKKDVISILSAHDFAHNETKTVIRGPGARRLVLGMNVDGPTPRLSREFRDQIRLHLHYLSRSAHGVAQHAKSRKTSISSIYHHVRGLIAWAQRVEPRFGAACLSKFDAIGWPPISRVRDFN